MYMYHFTNPKVLNRYLDYTRKKTYYRDLSMRRHPWDRATQVENNSSYLIDLRKFWNISRISASHSRSNITTHDLTLSTVSRIEVRFVYDRLDLSDRFSNEDTINWKTSCITLNGQIIINKWWIIFGIKTATWLMSSLTTSRPTSLRYLYLIIIIRSIRCSYPCYLTYARGNRNLHINIGMPKELISN